MKVSWTVQLIAVVGSLAIFLGGLTSVLEVTSWYVFQPIAPPPTPAKFLMNVQLRWDLYFTQQSEHDTLRSIRRYEQASA